MHFNLFFFLLVGFGVAAQAEDRHTLQGLKGVEVLIENFSLNTEEGELRAETIHSQVEGQLRQASIPVLSRSQALDSPGKPYLYVNLNALDNGADGYVFSISLELKQEVELPQDGRRSLIAVTWKNHLLGATPTKAASPIRQFISDQIDTFIVDYQRANRAKFIKPTPPKIPLKSA